MGAALLGAAAALLWLLLPSGDTGYPRDRITFATGAGGGVYSRYGSLLRPKIQADLPGVRVTLRDSEGSVENVKLVATGKRTLAIAAADAVADYDGRGRAGLRACARLYDDYVHLLVPSGSEVDRASDLKGLRVGVGPPDSGVRLLADRLLKAAGLDPERDIVPVKVGIKQAPRLLRQQKLDAFFWSGGLPTEPILTLTGNLSVRLVPLGDLVQPLREELGGSGAAHSYYRQAVLPPDAYPAAHPHGGAVSTIAVANLLVTTDRADDRLVERLTRTVIDSRDEIGRKVHAAQLMDLRTAIYTDPLRLHRGAQRYYRSVKP